MANDNTWISLHRCMKDWRWYKDTNTKSLFIHLLLVANHAPKDWQNITVERGQMATSIGTLSLETGLTVKQVRVAIRKLVSTGEITTKGTNKYTLITIANYDFYQGEGGREGKQRANKGQTKGKQRATNKNVKNVKNEKKDIYCPADAEQIVTYMNKKWGTNYRPTTRATVSLIQARLNEGFTVEDFIRVIDNQTAEWKHDSKMKKFLRPQTLFSGKFESYLNSEVSDEAKKKRLAEEAGEIMEKGGTVW